MIAIPLIGALLVFCGIVYTVRSALRGGRMSEPHSTSDDPGDVTLEPREHRTQRGLKDMWPGFAMIVVGALLLLLPFPA